MLKRLLIVPLVLTYSVCFASERFALVIGNSDYERAPLRNPTSDADAVSSALQRLDFSVTTEKNLDLRAMKDAVARFNGQLGNGNLGLFFFAGHGIQVSGENFLIPLGAKMREKYEVAHECLPVNLVLDAMAESRCNLKVIVLDCCRNNPFKRSWRTRNNSGNGLAPIGQVPEGTLISFATAPGKQALDGQGQNSPYTAHLVRALKSRPANGLELVDVFRTASRAVKVATGQSPWLNMEAGMEEIFLWRATKSSSQSALVNRWLDVGDRNKDGRISREELLERFPERMINSISRGDTNGDDFLDQTELESLSSKLQRSPVSRSGRDRPTPDGAIRIWDGSQGILVLDNCNDQSRGKHEYNDNITLLDSAGQQVFRVSGFNNCESIGSSRMIATDTTRNCFWVIENVAHRLRRFDLAGKETLTISGVHGSAIAVDPQTGNVWALASEGQIGNGKTVVYNESGKLIASYSVTGWDIAYDQKAKAFWIADKNLTKITAATGKVVFSASISTWCASSVDVDPKSGSGWVAVRNHPGVAGSSNRLLKFNTVGELLVAIDLQQNVPFRVSVDPEDGSVWVAYFRKGVERFSNDGKSDGKHDVTALAVQVDPSGRYVWVVTPEEIQKMTVMGNVTRRLRHAGISSQAWITSLQ